MKEFEMNYLFQFHEGPIKAHTFLRKRSSLLVVSIP